MTGRRMVVPAATLLLIVMWAAAAVAVVPQVTRFAGADRIDPSLRVAQDRWGFEDDLRFVVLARADAAADALAATPLARTTAVRGAGRILLTGSDSLDPRTAQTMSQFLAPGERVYLAGGTAALSDTVAQQVTDLGYTVQRLAGPTRFDTAVAIARAVAASDRIVTVADGGSFQEALLAGYAATVLGEPTVLTDGTRLPAVTRDFLDARAQLGVTFWAVGPNAAAALAGYGDRVRTFDATDPAQLAVDVAAALPLDNEEVGVASSENFPDALTGGSDAARSNGALLLTGRDQLSAPAAAYLADREPVRIRIYGGTAALSDAVGQALQGQPEPDEVVAYPAADTPEAVAATFVAGVVQAHDVSAVANHDATADAARYYLWGAHAADQTTVTASPLGECTDVGDISLRCAVSFTASGAQPGGGSVVVYLQWIPDVGYQVVVLEQPFD